MTKPRFQLRKLCFNSATNSPAILEFMPGLNVIHGASNTGKSFTVETMDFMLGGSTPPKDIPERVGYDKVSLDIWSSKDGDTLLERSIDGGDFLATIKGEEAITLSAKHSSKREDNLSSYLLGLMDLSNRQIKLNADGKKRGASFRDLVDFLIVPEETITKTRSPVLSGEYTTVTTEKSIFKLLLTGIDDSSFVGATKKKADTVSIQLIDQLISEFRSDLIEAASYEDVQDQLLKLESSISDQNQAVDSVQEDLQEALQSRNELSEKREAALARLDEVDGFLERFGLLGKHYSNDLLRLEAIKESGVLLGFLESKDCPLCGAKPENQNHEHSCDGDIKAVVDAATAEITKILQLKNELGKTVDELRDEHKSLRQAVAGYELEFTNLQKKVSQTLAPELAENKNKFSDLIKKHYEVSRTKEILEKIAALEAKKSQYRKDGKASEAVADGGSLSKAVLGDFSRKIEDILQAWGFPGAGRVYFDETKFDIVVSDKPRGSHGKGLRAITHAAFNIALLEFCMEKDLPHPGIVVLDSPLLAYREPDPGDQDVHETDLKDKFYTYLSKLGTDVQIVIAENVPPPEALENANIVCFTGNPDLGRFGLFPAAKGAS
ncbi:MAG: AAA family ATPase [Alphaproteobacteria bacterium]|nr:AAA family ATPase [Alphaproteobacteria bacterium]